MPFRRAAHAAPRDVVLVAGKGHEDYQELPASSTLQRCGRGASAGPGAAARGAWRHDEASARHDDAGAGAGAAARWCPRRLVGDAATLITRVHTDTRTLQAGDLFVALKGERFDAHDFIAQAVAAGAVAVLAERGDFAQGSARGRHASRAWRRWPPRGAIASRCP